MGADRKTSSTSRAFTRRTTQKVFEMSFRSETPAFPSRPARPPTTVRASTGSLLFDLLALDGPRPHLGLAAHEREVLPHGVALEGLGQHELDQMGMALEHDAEQLPALALVPAGPGVEVRDGGTPRVVARDGHLEPDVVVSPGRVKVRDDLDLPPLRV